MAYLALSVSPSTSAPATASFLAPSSKSTAKACKLCSLQPLDCCFFKRPLRVESARGRGRSFVVGMAPEEEKMTRRSPLDFPIEWDRPKPSRRPDIFPQFSPMKTPLPPPMPADPPEEDEEEEEEKKEEEEEDPDKENPDKPE